MWISCMLQFCTCLLRVCYMTQAEETFCCACSAHHEQEDVTTKRMTYIMPTVTMHISMIYMNYIKTILKYPGYTS